MRRRLLKLPLAPSQGWALYDWANSAFATVVMAGFFPVFFKQFWSSGLSVTQSTFRLGLANSLAGLIVALFAPWLGAFSDRDACGGWRRKGRLLLICVLLGATATGSLALVPQKGWAWALGFYALAIMAYEAGNIFYDSLLVEVAPASQWDRLSAFGYALGYLGGGCLFGLLVFAVSQPSLLGFSGPASVIRFGFGVVACWWVVFALPLLWSTCVEKAESAQYRISNEGRGFGKIWNDLKGSPQILRFLCAYWLIMDGVYTVMMMAVDYGLAIGLKPKDLMQALLVTQFVGFPSAIAFVRVAGKIGTKRGILLGVLGYMLVTYAGFRLQSATEFYALAFGVGLLQGGLQALMRSHFAQMIPPGKNGEFFGFFNMLGKFATILGPIVLGTVGLVFDNPRWAILSLLLFFGAGLWVLFGETNRRT